MVDLKLALRTLTRSPLVTGVAVLSLALGIGANTAIFSAYDYLLLRSLPVREPERLVNLGSPGVKAGSIATSNAGGTEDVFSYPMFRDLSRAQTVLTGIAAHSAVGVHLGVPGHVPTNLSGLYVSGSYFPVLGLRAALGRLLTPQDDAPIGQNRVVVVGYDYWQTQLGARADILNQPIVVNGEPMTIVGVAPRGFRGTTTGAGPAVFVPITMRGLLSRGAGAAFEDRRAYWAYLFARLRPGVTIEQARLALAATYRPIITDVEAPLQEGLSPTMLEQFRKNAITVSPGRLGQSNARREAATSMMLLFGVTATVLLIACANLANLLLSRAAERSTEMAVRLALGATRRQLVAQLLTESSLLALAGGVVSLLLIQWTLAFLAAAAPADAAPVVAGMLNLKVLLFGATLSVCTGVMFGLFPALHSTRPDLIATIRANSGQPSGARATARVRTLLVTSQIAFSSTLLILAGLFVKSLHNVSTVDLGIEADNIVTFGISPELNRYDATRSLALFDRVLQELRATPGVTAVAASRVPILRGSTSSSGASVEGFTKDAGASSEASFNQVSKDYFKTLGVPLLAGREFDAADIAGRQRVAVVNEAFAKKFNLGRDAVGKFMSMDGAAGANLDIQIVGLVQNAKYSAVREVVPPLFFLPAAQDSSIGFMTFYVRTSLDPKLLVRALPNVVSRQDPNLPVQNLRTLPEQATESIRSDRLLGLFSASFAVLATLLAAIGLYGVLSFNVSQRTREFGIRMALGANGSDVRMMVLRQVARMTVIGAVVGVVGALALGRAAQSMLFGVQGSDPLVIGPALVLLSLVALGAGFVPAFRASNVHPMQALRYE